MAICEEPTPEVPALMRALDCLVGAADEREVQDNDGIRPVKPGLDNIVRAQIALHDPLLLTDKLFLNSRP